MEGIALCRIAGKRVWRGDITICGFSHTQYFQRRKDARQYINKLKKAEQLCRTNLTANKSVDLETAFDREAKETGIKWRSEALRYRYLLDYIRQWVEGNDSPHIYNLD